MPAKPRKRPTLTVPVRADLQLTADEIKRLESRAAGEVRSVANLIAWWMEQELAVKPRARKPRDANPKLKRRTYPVNLRLTVPERRESTRD